ncbi:hypothetical protein [Sphingomonas sp. PAMC 26617]|uniref:hypothetical protein n=1 Tax=Sphingomonas sp. PAMC 26617 TaxID=1112216 RepID=UPI001E478BFE|nr:hypothetical protein [Sphingomonas sp. PAMC 26617]
MNGIMPGMAIATFITTLLQAASTSAVAGIAPVPAGAPEWPTRLSVPRAACAPEDDPNDIVVCGRPNRRNSQRLERLDPRFERVANPTELLERRLSDTATMTGGGPKGSVGITITFGLK